MTCPSCGCGPEPQPVYHQTGQKIGPCLRCGVTPDDAADDSFWTGDPDQVNCQPQHADYPHEPGRLYDCPACEASCHCTPGYTQCVYTGEHNGTADEGQERHETAGVVGDPVPAIRRAEPEPSTGPNADGNPYTPYTPEHRVWAKAQEHGKAAASWVTDGNTTQATYRRLLKGIEDGDPEVLDSVQEPFLADDQTDDYSQADLLKDAGWVPHDGTDLRDDLASQYLSQSRIAFWNEVERTCLANLPHREVDSTTQLGNRFITCACGHRESGGVGDQIARQNMNHHYKTAREARDATA